MPTFFYKISSTLFSILNILLDFLFPKEKIETEIENMSAKEILERGNTDVVLAKARISSITSIFSYKDPFVKKLIEIVKYKGNKKVIDNCGEIIYKEIIKTKHKNLILIPIPSSNKRRREKGFNQTELLCESILKNNPELFDYQKNILIKTKHRISQTKLKRKDRLDNLKNSMEIKNSESEELIKNREIILIDDVWTTGATTSEAVRVLEEAGVKSVYIYTLAH